MYRSGDIIRLYHTQRAGLMRSCAQFYHSTNTLNKDETPMNEKILLVDDHTLIREGLRSILEVELGMKVIGQAADGLQAVSSAEELRPDIIIMDVELPLLNGREATRRIKQRNDSVRIIALSMHGDRGNVIGMFQSGADAYLLKHCAVDELQDAIHAVLSGRRYLSNHLTDVLLESFATSSPGTQDAVYHQLTARERQVLQLIAEGRSTKEAAAILGCAISTVETHRQHLFNKLQVQSVADLTKEAIRLGLTHL